MKRVAWMALAMVGFLITVAVAVYLWRSGLERADKLASGIGAVAGVASLLLGSLQLIRGGGSEPAPTVHNEVGGEVWGQVVQAHTITGDIDLRGRG